jgi:hypothetical protein
MRNVGDRVPNRRRYQVHRRRLGVAADRGRFTTVALLTCRHFDRVAGAIALSVSRPRDGESEETPAEISNLAIVPVAHLDRGACEPSPTQPRWVSPYWHCT